ncbi:MAG: sporulation protein YunB [Clostridia bacterium]|nr:sporulation protein YunB [Clostridia bacterium]
MDKIYSRKRIIIPKISFSRINNFKNYNNRNSDKNNNKKGALLKVIIILIIEIIVARNVVNAVNPIIKRQCSNKAKSIATIICNEQATVVMENYKYEDLAVVIKDENGKIQMIKLNIIPVNEIISDVPLKIQEALNNVEDTKFGIRLGSFTGVKLLSGVGPYVKVRMSTIGTVETELKSEFKTAGINQTIHQIYLDIKCNVSILTPFNSTTEEIRNQVLIAESIIVGEIPSSYYNFEGLEEKDALEIME